MPGRTLFAVVIAVLSSVSAFGTAQRTFVASNGNDMNSCNRTDPCRSFGAAIAQTNANGEVVAIDSAGYGPVTITQSATIVAPLGVHAGISVFMGDGVTINAGMNDVIVLRNLYINSQGGVNGITLHTGAALHVEHCVVSGFSSNNVNLVPTNSAAVAITDTVSRQAGGSGIYADSASPLIVSIDRCRMERAFGGVLADRATIGISNSTADNSVHGFYARGSGGSANMAIEACVVSNNSYGVEVDSGSSLSVHNTTALNNSTGYLAYLGKLSLDHCVAAGGVDGVHVAGDASVTDCTIADNTDSGILVSLVGIGRLTRNTITRNGTGIQNGGTVHSSGDNVVDGNGTETAGGGTTGPANKV